jgi:hypothetical protein
MFKVFFSEVCGGISPFLLDRGIEHMRLQFDAFTDENTFRPFYRFYCKEETTIQKIIDILERQAFTWT